MLLRHYGDGYFSACVCLSPNDHKRTSNFWRKKQQSWQANSIVYIQASVGIPIYHFRTLSRTPQRWTHPALPAVSTIVRTHCTRKYEVFDSSNFHSLAPHSTDISTWPSSTSVKARNRFCLSSLPSLPSLRTMREQVAQLGFNGQQSWSSSSSRWHSIWPLPTNQTLCLIQMPTIGDARRRRGNTRSYVISTEELLRTAKSNERWATTGQWMEWIYTTDGWKYTSHWF